MMIKFFHGLVVYSIVALYGAEFVSSVPLSATNDVDKGTSARRMQRSASPLLLDILAEKKFHLIDYEDGKRQHHHNHNHHGGQPEPPYGEEYYSGIGYNNGGSGGYHNVGNIGGGSFSGSSAQAGSFSGNQGGGNSQSQSNAASQSASFGIGPFQASFSSSQANSASFSGGGNNGDYNDRRHPYGGFVRPYRGY